MIRIETSQKEKYKWQWIHEKMFNIISHGRNVDQNYDQLSPYLSKNDYYYKTKK
jgi:hypothetical protein